LASFYILTLTTTTASRAANSTTNWILTRRDNEGVLASGVSVDDLHGDRARVDGRGAARKHANSLGRRFSLSDVQVRYSERPLPVAPIPTKPAP
jgi:hypothetical protein